LAVLYETRSAFQSCRWRAKYVCKQYWCPTNFTSSSYQCFV